ncbi:hypothetical protein MNBD_UNCLBAC01-148 [hydrothermal vent metagenome]|uniref:Uncharacterized protein n=1 Tax=hydrothermal vent metagenome TaxID=652676 RepID=A0A3B1DTC6_9ZZZZ
MNSSRRKLRVGIVGCGAIGSRIAHSICHELKPDCLISGLYDVLEEKTFQLEKKLSLRNKVYPSLEELIKNCDFVVEAVNAKNTRSIIRQALQAKRSVLVMSVGKMLNAQDLFKLAKINKCNLLLPSGAIAGIDAIKAASLVGIDTLTLTTRKPIAGFKDNVYFLKKGVDLSQIKKETIIFEGGVEEAVRLFPQNINVAATIALASGVKKKMVIRILTSPRYKINSHEIEMTGSFGRMVTRTENCICPDNPKTSYLAVLSGIQTLKQFCEGVLIGT